MRMRSIVLCMLAGLAPAIGPRAAASLDQAAAASQQDLESSLRELAELREQIASEKVPMTRELDALEGRLTELRRAGEQAIRDVEAAGLNLSVLQGETKLRQEEQSYVTGLLDEYARSFESRLHVSELQRYGDLVEAAKQAPGNENLQPAEKLDRQLTVAEASVARLDELIGGARFDGTAVDPQGVVAEGKFTLIGPVALFASNDGSASGVAMPQSGSNQPTVRPLDGSLRAGLTDLIERGKGILPLDPTRGAALKELAQRASLVHIFKKGGPIMWPLLAVSILALGTVIERVLFILKERKRRDDEALQGLLDAVQQGDVESAVGIGERSKYYVTRALAYALRHRERSLPNALLYANAQEIKRFSRGIPILDTAITISPLLGLLGTVTGMMSSFSLIGGDLGAPGAITGGIAEALIATAFGLGIAILALIPFNYLNNQVDEVRHELEAAATQLELLAHPPAVIRAAALAATGTYGGE